MKAIRIIAITKTGRLAIEKHISETFKEKKKVKLMFKMLGFHQSIINEYPYTLELTIKNPNLQKLLKEDHLINEITDTLSKNGAGKDIDYKVEAV